MTSFEALRKEKPGKTQREIKRGGFAIVEEVSNERGRVARKRLKFEADQEIHKQNVRRFHREIELIQSLNFPYIAQIYDAFDYAYDDHLQSVPAYTMEMAACSLQDFWNENGKVSHWNRSTELYFSLLNQAALAIAFIHANGIIHRDIKPSNFLVYADDRLSICDFGIANGHSVDHDDLTRFDTQIFSKEFAAPEQAQSLARADERSDVYSFGSSMFYLATGSYLSYDSQHNAEAFSKIPSLLTEFIKNCTRLDPGDRFQNGTELVLEFRKLYIGLAEEGYLEQVDLHPSFFEAHAKILRASENGLVPHLPVALSVAPASLGQTCDLLTHGAIETLALSEDLEPVFQSVLLLRERYLETTAWSNAEKVAKVFATLLKALLRERKTDLEEESFSEFSKSLAESVLLVSARLNRFEGARWFLRMFAEPHPLSASTLEDILDRHPDAALFVIEDVHYERIRLTPQAKSALEAHKTARE